MTSPPNPLVLLLFKLEGHSRLESADRQAILALPYVLKTFEAGSYVGREADVPKICPILVEGFAFRQKLTGDGARQIVGLHIPGDPIDLQNLYLDISDHNVQMLTRATVALVPRPTLQQLAHDHPLIAHAITVHILIEAAIFREWILNIGRRPAMPRLAHLLCEFAVRLEAQGLADDHGYELPMTQEQLADALGLTPVHVNRTIRALEQQGFIERDKKRIRFPDWRLMIELADFNRRYLHLEPQKTGVG